MSLEELHTEVQGYRTTAGRLAEEYNTTHAEVTNDHTLTDTGKRERLEPLHEQITEQMHQLHAREKAAVKTYKENLERNLYGLSPTASNNVDKIRLYREAQTLTRELDDSDDATTVYESAKRSGDTILAAAVLEKALIRGWKPIINDYLEKHPGTRDNLNDLAALAQYTDNSLAVTAQYMAPAANLPRPPAGFPKLGDRTASAPPRKVPDLADAITQRLNQDGTQRF